MLGFILTSNQQRKRFQLSLFNFKVLFLIFFGISPNIENPATKCLSTSHIGVF